MAEDFVVFFIPHRQMLEEHFKLYHYQFLPYTIQCIIRIIFDVIGYYTQMY